MAICSKFSHNPEHGGGKGRRGGGSSAQGRNYVDDGNYGALMKGDAKLGINDGLKDKEKGLENR